MGRSAVWVLALGLGVCSAFSPSGTNFLRPSALRPLAPQLQCHGRTKPLRSASGGEGLGLRMNADPQPLSPQPPGSLGRRAFSFLFSSFLLLGPEVASAKTSAELQKEVAGLEGQVEKLFKEATSLGKTATKNIDLSLAEGEATGKLFNELATLAGATDQTFSSFKQLGSQVSSTLEKEEDTLGEKSVAKYEQAEETAKVKGEAEKASQLFDDAAALKKETDAKVAAQKDWTKVLSKLDGSEAKFAQGVSANDEALNLLKDAMKDADEAKALFMKGFAGMNGVKLFSDSGSAPDAKEQLDQIKGASAAAKSAQDKASKASGQLNNAAKTILGATTDATAATATATRILGAISSDGKLKETALKNLGGVDSRVKTISAKAQESTKKTQALLAALKTTTKSLQSAYNKYASAEKAGIKAEEIYALVEAQVAKEKEELAKYRKARKSETTKLVSEPEKSVGGKASVPKPGAAPQLKTGAQPGAEAPALKPPKPSNATKTSAANATKTSKPQAANATKPQPPKPAEGSKPKAPEAEGSKPKAPAADGSKPKAPAAEGSKPNAPVADGSKPNAPEAPKLKAPEPPSPKPADSPKPKASEGSKPADNPKPKTAEPTKPTEAPKPKTPEPAKPEAPKSEAPKPKPPTPDSAKPEAPKSESPKPNPKTPEAPKADAPKPKPQASEAPKAEAPKPKSPAPEVPKSEAPKSPSPPSKPTEAPKPPTAKKAEDEADLGKMLRDSLKE